MKKKRKRLIILVCILLILAISIIAFVFIHTKAQKAIDSVEISIDTVRVRDGEDVEYVAGKKFDANDGQTLTEYYTPIAIDIRSNEYVKYIYKISNNTSKTAYCEMSITNCSVDNYLISFEKSNMEEQAFENAYQFEIEAGQIESIIIYFRIDNIEYDALITGEIVLKVEVL